MSWRDEPASSSQLTTIRDFYSKAIGWSKANEKVKKMKESGISKGGASDEIKRLYELNTKGQWVGPIED